jgi:organic radical activating enzyme
MSSSLWCPLAFRNITVENDGDVSKYATCCRGRFAVDEYGKEITSDTHTPSQAFELQYFKDIRSSLLKGVEHPNCESCWSLERQGIESMRQTEVQKTHFRDTGSPRADLEYIDISFGNTCNLKCRTCTPIDSTTWIKESWDLGEKTIPIRDFARSMTKTTSTDSEFFRDLVDYSSKHTKGLSFYGGEPTIMPQTWKLVKELSQSSRSQDIFLYFNTNLTSWKKDNIDLLDRFQHVTFGMSMDGVGSRFEYMRHPAKWAKVRDNIENMIRWRDQQPNKRDLYIIHTVSAYNILYMNEIFDFAQARNLKVYVNGCFFDEDNFAIQHIPTELRQRIFERIAPELLDEPEAKKILDCTSWNGDDSSWQAWLADVAKRDAYRKESFADVFSEYWRLINE